MSTEQHAMREIPRMIRIHFVAIASGLMLLGVQARAQDVDGPTYANAGCMQKQFGIPVTGANKLNCTANDIKLSRALNVSQPTCIRGTTFDLTATFEVNVTANARYDAGFFFRTDGGASARGDGIYAAGICSLSALEHSVPANPPTLNLDGDSCGDLNASPAGTPHLVTFTIPGVLCEAAPGTNLLRLPNCTSWHSNQGTACDISSPADFKPDTKSKCVCDDAFTVEVKVEDATLLVGKSAFPTSVPEPGQTVVFTVTIENAATTESVIIDSIVDNIFGDIGASTDDAFDPDNDCDDLIGTTLLPGADNAVECKFSRLVEGDFGDPQHEDTVTVTATQPSTGNEIEDDGTATVDFTDIYTEPTVAKKAASTANCSVEATYEVVVSNNSTIDTLSINSLSDNKFGNIATVHAAGGGFEEVVSTTCNSVDNLFPTIDQQGSYSCSFVGRITSATCDFSHTNKVTASVTDDDGKSPDPAIETDDVIVEVSTTP